VALGMLAGMKRFLQMITLVGVMLSLNSCGLPGALTRSVGRLGTSAGDLLNNVN
jgi:hypothetical protein